MTAAKPDARIHQASKQPVTLTVDETDALLSLLNRIEIDVVAGERWRPPIEQHSDELDEVISELGARQFGIHHPYEPDDKLLALRFQRNLAALRLTWPPAAEPGEGGETR
jgi:hypothetical protein